MHELVAQGEHAALVVEADLHRVRLRALLRGGQHVLHAILEPAHGTAEAHREQRDEHVLRIHDQLGAEAAADVGGDHAHVVGRKIEHLADELADLVRHLGRRPRGEPSPIAWYVITLAPRLITSPPRQTTPSTGAR